MIEPIQCRFCLIYRFRSLNYSIRKMFWPCINNIFSCEMNSVFFFAEPLMVIVEFCAYGNLQSLLRASRDITDQYYLDCYKRPASRLTSNELLMFGTQIARGMAHLACLKVHKIHCRIVSHE